MGDKVGKLKNQASILMKGHFQIPESGQTGRIRNDDKRHSTDLEVLAGKENGATLKTRWR